MTAVAWGLLALAGVAAATDWVAVARGRRRLELVAKPAATALLVGVAVTLTPQDPTVRAWFVAALLLSLTGDVLLMLDRFVPGLAAFLLAHVAYIGGFLTSPAGDGPRLLLGLFVVVIAFAAIGRRVLAKVRAAHADVLVPVSAYLVVISAMVVAAGYSGRPLGLAGAAVFCLSDSIIAEDRFVAPRPWAPVAIMVTYHLAQALLVLSLT